MANKVDQFCNQAANSPIDSVENFEQYVKHLGKIVEWNHVGILSDEGNRNNILLLLNSTEVVATLRLSMTPKDVSSCICKLAKVDKPIEYRCIQGQNITRVELANIGSIDGLWFKASSQSKSLSTDRVEHLFVRFEDDRKKKGRGKAFSVKTQNTVWKESYGRCMFRGCGERLDQDEVSGVTGNFAYLAHNVASSELGERGIVLLSEELSDDPENVLLLCDKHHRLIDKVAASDYTAPILSEMKKEFGVVANGLLDGLKYHPIPVYAVLWPVNSQTVSPPTHLQIANSLSKIKRRMHQQINILNDNEDILISNPEILWNMMPTVINTTAEKLLQQTREHGFHAALFGFGPSSALIGLGAKLGNKNSIMPMLRYRQGGDWSWPSGIPVGTFFEIEGLETLENNTDFVVNIALTAEPESLVNASKAISLEKGAQVLTIRAKEEYMGNGAIPHPEDGRQFTAELQSIFHKLQSSYGAKTIHLFPCASNAASVFIGQAYDTHHPEVIVYDFDDKSMVPRLRLSSDNHQCNVSSQS
ncbi:MAG: SAVED domain-containing protein [Psychrobium sp.]